MSYKNLIGIAVFGYNRPTQLEKTLSKILEYISESPFNFKVKVFIDGLKKNEDKKNLKKILLLKKKFNLFDFKISKINKGLKKSILSGIDEIATDSEFFLVFEDDILLLSNLDNLIEKVIKKKLMLKYSTLCLYCSFGINFRNFFKKLKLIETYRMQCWGWFTSSDNWKNFRAKASNEYFKQIENNKKEYFLKVGQDSFERLQQTIYNNRDVWACRWIAFNYIIKKPSLVPSISYIKNIGVFFRASNNTNPLSVFRELLNQIISYLRFLFINKSKFKIRKIKKTELEIITGRRKII